MIAFANLVLDICSIAPSDFETATESSRARRWAAGNLEANRAALEEIWPPALRLAPDELPLAEYLMARDGALTARFEDGRWFGGCSVPKRAAVNSLARFEMSSNAATLLAPQHPQVIVRALDGMRPDQALIVIIPQDDTYALTLCLHDFSQAIRARRLWFAPGLDWTRAFVELLDKLPGLPPPTQLIRIGSTTSWLSDRIQQLADSAIVRTAQSQADSIARLANRRRGDIGEIKRVCVIGSSRFNLWGGAHNWLHVHRDQFQNDFDVTMIDLADPVSRSNYFVARQIDTSDAILSAEIGRSDQPGIASMDVPWITLCSQRTPMCAGAGTLDRLMVCSEELFNAALKSGWARNRIDHVAPIHSARSSKHGRIALIANLDEIREPAVIETYSSHLALWRMLAKCLGDMSFVPRQSPANLVLEAATKFGIDPQQLPVELFLNRLIAPSWMLSVARRLKAQKINFDIYGEGWNTQSDLQEVWQGPIESADGFSRAISNTGWLLDVWPAQTIHPARNIGIKIVPTWGDPVRQLKSSMLLSKRGVDSGQSLLIGVVTRIVRDVPRMIQT